MGSEMCIRDRMDIPSLAVMLAAVVVTVWTGIQYLVDAKKLKG